jgi:hypothetical protein
MDSNTKLSNYKQHLLNKEQEEVNKIKQSLSYKINSFIFHNKRLCSFMVIDLCNTIFLHFLDTIKVRNQAKSVISDTSEYFKNDVIRKGLISGVVSSSIGSLVSSYVFISSNEYFLHKYFSGFNVRNNIVVGCDDWKKRIYMSFIFSDILKVISILPFEGRKMRIQLGQLDKSGIQSNLTDKIFFSNLIRSCFPYIIRDLLTRCITLGTYFSLLNAIHSPRLKYSLDEVQYIIKQNQSLSNNMAPIDSSLFYDYSSFHVISNLHEKLMVLLVSVMLSTIVTQPLDVLITKYLTQTNKVYTGNYIKDILFIINNEGLKKLFMSGLSPRFSFNLISGLNISLFLDLIQRKVIEYNRI